MHVQVCVVYYRMQKEDMFPFIHELLGIFPNSLFKTRKGYPLKSIVSSATTHGFTDLMVVHEDNAEVSMCTRDILARAVAHSEQHCLTVNVGMLVYVIVCVVHRFPPLSPSSQRSYRSFQTIKYCHAQGNSWARQSLEPSPRGAHACLHIYMRVRLYPCTLCIHVLF